MVPLIIIGVVLLVLSPILAVSIFKPSHQEEETMGEFIDRMEDYDAFFDDE